MISSSNDTANTLQRYYPHSHLRPNQELMNTCGFFPFPQKNPWIRCTLKLYLLKDFIQIYEVFHLFLYVINFYEWYNLMFKFIFYCYHRSWQFFVSCFNNPSAKHTPEVFRRLGGSHYCSKESLLGYQKVTDTVWRALEKFPNSNTGKHRRENEFSSINQTRVLILSYLRQMNGSKVLWKCRVAANLLSGITFIPSGKYRVGLNILNAPSISLVTCPQTMQFFLN